MVARIADPSAVDGPAGDPVGAATAVSAALTVWLGNTRSEAYFAELATFHRVGGRYTYDQP